MTMLRMLSIVTTTVSTLAAASIAVLNFACMFASNSFIVIANESDNLTTNEFKTVSVEVNGVVYMYESVISAPACSVSL